MIISENGSDEFMLYDFFKDVIQNTSPKFNKNI